MCTSSANQDPVRYVQPGGWMLSRATAVLPNPQPALSARQSSHTPETAYLLRCTTVLIQKTISFVPHYKSGDFQILLYQRLCYSADRLQKYMATNSEVLSPLLDSGLIVENIHPIYKRTLLSFYPSRLAAETSPSFTCLC